MSFDFSDCAVAAGDDDYPTTVVRPLYGEKTNVIAEIGIRWHTSTNFSVYFVLCYITPKPAFNSPARSSSSSFTAGAWLTISASSTHLEQLHAPNPQPLNSSTRARCPSFGLT